MVLTVGAVLKRCASDPPTVRTTTPVIPTATTTAATPIAVSLDTRRRCDRAITSGAASYVSGIPDTRSFSIAREVALEVVHQLPDSGSGSSAARNTCSPRDVGRFHRADGEPERVGRPLLGHVEVVATDDHLALAHRERLERLPQLLVSLRVVRARRGLRGLPVPLGFGFDAIGVPSLNARVAVVGANEIDDGLAQVRAEGVGTHVTEPARDAQEGLLREILGELTLAGEEVGEVDHARGLGAVEGGQPIGAPDRLAGRVHRQLAYHTLKTPTRRRGFPRSHRAPGAQPARASAMRRTPSPRSSSPRAKLSRA